MGLVLIGLMVSYLSGVGASVFIDLILGWRVRYYFILFFILFYSLSFLFFLFLIHHLLG